MGKAESSHLLCQPHITKERWLTACHPDSAIMHSSTTSSKIAAFDTSLYTLNLCDTILMVSNMSYVDLIIILGKQLSRKGAMPSDLIDRLDAVVEYLRSSSNMQILVSGKYSMAYDEQGFIPNHYECDVMYEYLVSKGIGSKLIDKECESKDTSSNIKYAKKYLLDKPNIKNIMIVCAKHHQPRVKLLVERYLDNSYHTDYLTLDANPTPEELALEQQYLRKVQQDR